MINQYRKHENKIEKPANMSSSTYIIGGAILGGLLTFFMPNTPPSFQYMAAVPLWILSAIIIRHSPQIYEYINKHKLKFIPASVILIISVSPILLIHQSNKIIETLTSKSLFNNTNKIPYNEVGLVLGASKYVYKKRINLYFKYRIDATVALFKAGKIKKILVSGDNAVKGYDEPTDIKNELINAGIPANCIYLDYAGFRTLDSIIRANKIFGLKQFTIISQKFHNQRAVYIANYFSIQSIAFNAKDVKGSGSIRTNLREKLARVKTILDLYLLKTKPKFLGKKIEIL
jgi:SanA protein